ncbi:MAG: hypothetical protein NC305_18865 [Lachnospiraceae bacterium]|nr:hypothetical protein [Lachnospiraceae bacterium]
MTNAQIIFNESVRLMEEGIIGTTGLKIEVVMENGETVSMMEPEPIHTYAAWKSLGFQVKRGETAIAKFLIWKAGKSRQQEDAENAAAENSVEISPERVRMFMKTAHFFKISQVERISATA